MAEDPANLGIRPDMMEVLKTGTSLSEMKMTRHAHALRLNGSQPTFASMSWRKVNSEAILAAQKVAVGFFRRHRDRAIQTMTTQQIRKNLVAS